MMLIPKKNSLQEPDETAHLETIHGALFEDFVIQQGQTALVLMGRLPGETDLDDTPDLEAAKVLIDQLEMLRFKTQGNLRPEETLLLDRSLRVLRRDFAQAMEEQSS